MKTHPRTLAGVCIGILGICLVACTGAGGEMKEEGTGTETVQEKKVLAWHFAQKLVEQHLRSPSTADFGDQLAEECVVIATRKHEIEKRKPSMVGKVKSPFEKTPEEERKERETAENEEPPEYRTETFYVVRGWVDSQNGFGATIRTQFLLQMELSTSGDKTTARLREPIRFGR